MISRRSLIIRAFRGYGYSCLKPLSTIIILTVFICFYGNMPLLAGTTCKGDYIEWFNNDVGNLAYIMQNNKEVNGLFRFVIRVKLRKEIETLENKIALILDNPAYTHPTLGFYIYDPDAAGWLHALYKARNARKHLLSSHLEDFPPENKNINILSDGTPLFEAGPDMVPEIEEVVKTIEGMSLPPVVFRGYKIFILPFSMGEISGLGSKGYMLLGAPPHDHENIRNQVAFTVAHEIGHHIHMTFIGSIYEDNPQLWDEYMEIRGIPKWTTDGNVNSEAWFESTEETFAEDVRVIFGSGEAALWPHCTKYPDPRIDSEITEALRSFICKCIGVCC
ncbi:MAG: ImmA/IrrE family metallo-endopeptidase [Firmicutes bacterium]|nr:ImmA/IrrE family metallo-endopeptidase [Bacillota bacterium]